MDKRKPDWKIVIAKLLENRTQTELASEVGVAQQQISNLKDGKRGKNIGYTLGYDLLELYAGTKK